MGRFELALAANDAAETRELVENIRKGEGEQGTSWRLAHALYLIDQARRGDSTTVEAARTLASEIAARRADWWGAPLLNAQIAELQNRPEQALTGYMEAVKLGNAQPAVIRRLVGLLYERNQFDEIHQVARLLRDRGIALPELTVVEAINALRNGDYKQGIALVRQVFSDNSTSFSDQLTLGRFYYAAGHRDEAGKRFKRAVELAPRLPETWLIHIQYLVQTKHLDQAKTTVEAARQALAPDPTTLARCLMMVGDTTQAETAIQSALKEKPADPAALRLAASFYLERGRTEEAGKYLDALVALVPGPTPDDLAWANRTRASLLIRKGRFADADQALRLIDQNLARRPNSIEDLRLKASILALRPSRIEEAIKILEPLSGTNQLTSGDRFLLALLQLRGGQEAKYQGEMLRILEGKGKAPLHLAHYTSYLISRNQLEQADRWLAVLRQIEPKGQEVLELQAALFKARGRQSDLLALLKTRGREAPDQIGLVADLLNRYGFAKEAETAYKTFIARDPKQPERALALVRFLARQDRVAEAMAILKKAWSSCRPEDVALAALPVFTAPSASNNDRREVEAFVGQAVQTRPEAAVLRARLGMIWLRQSRFDEAEGLFRRLLATDPENVEALNSLAWLLALRDNDKAPEALQLINRAIELHGAKPNLLDTRAVVMIRAGQGQQAISDLRVAQDQNPRNVDYARHRAWAYQSAGKIDEAREFWRSAEEMNFRSDGGDPLERPFITKLRQDLSETKPSGRENGGGKEAHH